MIAVLITTVIVIIFGVFHMFLFSCLKPVIYKTGNFIFCNNFNKNNCLRCPGESSDRAIKQSFTAANELK